MNAPSVGTSNTYGYGNILITGGAEYVFLVPYQGQQSVRTSVF
ncbi:hypothetical protein ACI77F_26145 [Pseudomonas tritici]